jgi:hypothetical protein
MRGYVDPPPPPPSPHTHSPRVCPSHSRPPPHHGPGAVVARCQPFGKQLSLRGGAVAWHRRGCGCADTPLRAPECPSRCCCCSCPMPHACPGGVQQPRRPSAGRHPARPNPADLRNGGKPRRGGYVSEVQNFPYGAELQGAAKRVRCMQWRQVAAGCGCITPTAKGHGACAVRPASRVCALHGEVSLRLALILAPPLPRRTRARTLAVHTGGPHRAPLAAMVQLRAGRRPVCGRRRQRRAAHWRRQRAG